MRTMLLRNKYSFYFLLLFFFSFFNGQEVSLGIQVRMDANLPAGLNYPVPPKNSRFLFYVQRNKNTNAIVYETNLLENGSLNPENPVHVFWLRYSEDSTAAELSFIQRNYAYGLDSKPLIGKPGQFVLNFVSYEKKKFYLIPVGDDKNYQAFTFINGKMAILDRVFIRLNGGTFWFPVVEDIEMMGRDPQTNQVVIEHFKP